MERCSLLSRMIYAMRLWVQTVICLARMRRKGILED